MQTSCKVKCKGQEEVVYELAVKDRNQVQKRRRMQTMQEEGFPPHGYFFPTDRIPRLDYKDTRAQELISQEQPVILTGTGLCSSALKWDVDYLTEHMGPEKNVVFVSPNRKFKYCDHEKVQQYMPDYNATIEKLNLPFNEFIQRLKKWKTGDPRLYLQHPLDTNVGEALVADFVNFDWRWLNHQQKMNNWGPLTSNLLLIGMEGNVTPVHYDEQQNFFAQLVGFKRCLLFSPKHYDKLYPHPVYHPCDRQSQVDFDSPEFERFPGLDKLEGYEAILGPGDVLYIPMYWWHQVESKPDDGYTVSVNFWYKGGPTEQILYPLKSRQKMAVMRNVEKMLLEALKDPMELRPLLQSMVLGRYTDDFPDHL